MNERSGDEIVAAGRRPTRLAQLRSASAPYEANLPRALRQTTVSAREVGRNLLPRHGHLRRLDSVWTESPIYFITICTADRRRILARPDALVVLREEFGTAPERYGWTVGRYVAMPDHLFFCGEGGTAQPTSLSRFIGGFKQWTAKRILGSVGLKAPLWQREFFDHLLRAHESYEQKWRYVMDNLVRAGLVVKSEDWPYAGQIAPLFF